MIRANTLLSVVGAIFAVAGMTSQAAAQATAIQPAPEAANPLLSAQTRAADHGPDPITLRLQYTGEAGYNAVGGLRDGGAYLNNILGQLHFSSERALGYPGGKFVFEGFYQNADTFNQFVGAAQDPSVIDTDGTAMFRLYQAYYEQTLGNTSVLFGIYDLETEFGLTRPADVFFNGAYAWTTTLDTSGLNGPSTYPNTALALRIRQKLGEHWSIQGAVLDGVPDTPRFPARNAININRTNGAMMIGEVDYTPTRTTKIMGGFWNYTGKFESLSQLNPDDSPRLTYGSRGGYIGGATRIYSQTARRGLDVFANLGLARAETQQFDHSLNLGFTYTGLFDARPNDRLGFAVGLAHAGGPFSNQQNAEGVRVNSYETNFEVTYRARITNWLVIQPDIQYWVHPSVDPALKNDLLLMLHFEVSHVFDF